MSDARLQTWLEVTKRAVEASDAERIRALEHAHRERTELMRSLTERPAEAPDRELASELERYETALQELLERLPAELQQRVYDLRRARHAARGYLPTLPNDPSLISREV